LIIGILTRNPQGWASSRLIKAIESLGHRPHPFRFRDMVSIIDDDKLKVYARGVNLVDEVSAIIVRPIGRCSLEQAIYRMDVLYALQDYGVKIINKPSAIEKCIDKFRSLYILHMHGIPVPRTMVSENANLAYRSLPLLKSKSIVIKPIFGSRGHGSTRIRLRDRDVLWEVLHSLSFTRHVLYLQEYLPHKGKDIRAFVIGDKIIAAMYRVAPGMWKTNISQGARPIRIDKLDPEIEEIVLKSAKLLECEIAGVDVLVIDNKPYLLELNSQPGWRGLQSVTDKDIAMEIAKYVIEKAKK